MTAVVTMKLLIDIIATGLHLNLIAASGSNNNKSYTLLFQQTTTQLNDIKDGLMKTLDQQTTPNTCSTYTDNRRSRRTNNNWKTSFIFSDTM